jgi:hypothetical protein
MLENGPAIIRRAIVQQDQFEILKRLCEDGPDAPP